MNEEYGPDIITLTDDDGQEFEFEILDTLEHNGETYYALYPLFEMQEEDEEGYFILKEEIDADGEGYLAEIDDDALLEELGTLFDEHFNEMDFDEEEEDGCCCHDEDCDCGEQ